MENETVLVCEDTLDGIFTGIYEAYQFKKDNNVESHALIHLAVNEPPVKRLFTDYISIKASLEKSEKVSCTLKKILGGTAYYNLCLAASSSFEGKADAVYHTVVLGLIERDKNVLDRLYDSYVQDAFKCFRAAGNEVNHFTEFTRFSELDNGILYAKINARHHVLPFIMPHFSDRLPANNFVIYDEETQTFGLHPSFKKWYIVQGMDFDESSISYSQAEKEYQELFKCFCGSIAIEERKNPCLQRSLLPLRFRPNMAEFNTVGSFHVQNDMN